MPNSTLEKFAHNLIVYESDLPSGKGWSPLTWQILQGKSDVPVVLFEAVEKVDAGRIYYRGDLLFNGDELLSEMRKSQGNITIELCRRAVNEFNDLNQIGLEQSGEETYFPKRRPPDSRLNSDKTLREQFDLLRVVDNDRYPAFFEINGLRYELKIEKIHPM